MSLQPQKVRELVFQMLYSLSMGKSESVEELIAVMMRECKVTKTVVTEALHQAEKIAQSQDECDTYIEKACQEYSGDRIQSVERTILRLAIYELVIEKTLPANIVFAEAKRLAKKFSTDEAVPFVQGVLSAIAELCVKKEIP